MAKKIIFDEDLVYAQILRNSDEAKNYLEAKRDSEIEENAEKIEEISEKYKNKLQSIYRIRNNAFALMLRQGFECTAFKEGKENEEHIYLELEINGTKYVTEAISIKNVLFKDFENIISQSFNSDSSKIALEEVLVLSNKPQKEPKQTTPKQPKPKAEKAPAPVINEEYEAHTAEEMLDMMNDIKQEKPMYEIPAKKSETSASDLMPIFGDEFVIEDEKDTLETNNIDTEIDLDDETLSELEEMVTPVFSKESTPEIKEMSFETPVKEVKEVAQEIKNEPLSNVSDKDSFFDNFVIEEDFSVEEEPQNTTNDEKELIIEKNIDKTNEEESEKEADLVIEDFTEEKNKLEEETVEIDKVATAITMDDSKKDVEPVIKENIETTKVPASEKDEYLKSNNKVEQDFGDAFVIEDDSLKEDLETEDDNNFGTDFVIEDEYENTVDEIKNFEENEPQNLDETKVFENSADIDNNEEKTVVKIKKEEAVQNKLCPYCRGAVGESDTICSNCGFDLINNSITETELKDMDEEDSFDENDIKRILDEIKADYERAKREEREAEEKARLEAEEEAKKNPKIDLSMAPKNYARDNFKEVKMYSPNESDPVKKKAELICDIYKFKIMDRKNDDEIDEIERAMRERRLTVEEQKQLLAQKEAASNERKVREITAYLFPLTIPNNGTERFTEMALYIIEDGVCGVYCSEYKKNGSIKAKTEYHELVFQWSWTEGVPSSKFIPIGEQDNIIELKKEEIRPSDLKVVGFGHPYLTLSIEYLDGTETLHIHALNIPDTEPDDNGYLKCLYVLEEPKEHVRNMLVPKINNYKATFGFEDRIYTIGCKDCDDEIQLELVENKN